MISYELAQLLDRRNYAGSFCPWCGGHGHYHHEGCLVPNISGLLWIANSGAFRFDETMRREFYDRKTALLRKYGCSDGYDIQLIEKQCWDCDGQGTHWYPGGDDHDYEECRKCSGSGIYSRRMIRLDRYLIGGRTFHVPNGSIVGPITIRGLISHEAHPKSAWAARLLLDTRYTDSYTFTCPEAREILTQCQD